jgi:23S rRNA (uracil1939-C5)-methyltransferase
MASKKFHIPQIQISSFGKKGEGIAVHEDQQIFVPRAAIGDVVELQVEQDNNENFRGTILQIIEPSTDRRTPPCPYYHACGGCQMQHLKEDIYHAWKSNYLPDLFAKAGLNCADFKPLLSIPPATRRRVTFAAYKSNQEFRLGFHQLRSNQIVDTPSCLLLDARLEHLQSGLRQWLPKILLDNKPTDIFLQIIDNHIEMVITGALIAGPNRDSIKTQKGEIDPNKRALLAQMAVDLNLARIGWRKEEFAPIETLISLRSITKKMGKLDVEIPIGNFLQPSDKGEETLIECVKAFVPPKKKLKIMDLYAGCGTFSGPLLDYGHVTAVEFDKVAIEALKKAAGAFGHFQVEKRNLFEEPVTARELKSIDAVVMDPPRAGAVKQCEKLVVSTVPSVIYVSCNPSSFVRDALILQKAGYALRSVTPIDQFIWSGHLELVASFERQ